MKKLKKPVIGLAPMDGITDAAFRYITDKYGHSDILFTEFVSVDAITRGAFRVLTGFIHHKTETPTIAQLYGANPDNFYKSALVAAEMGFDGIDINMGCPENSIVHRGGGAGLILNPKLANKIILSVKAAMKDWAEGKTIDDSKLPDSVVDYVNKFQADIQIKPVKRNLPVSVKTRIGYDQIITEEWIKSLLDAEPAVISLHGRTLKQLYSGKADWEEIGVAARLTKITKTRIFGNGDIKSADEGRKKCSQYRLDGVLIGRAALGNPWVFSSRNPYDSEKMNVAVEHCEIYTKMIPRPHFQALRKHLSWYVKGLHGSHELRNQLMKVNNIGDVKEILLNKI